MPYQPYRTIPRDSNEKSGSLSGVSSYPLYLEPGYTTTTVTPTPPFDPASLSAPLITWFGKQDADIGYTAGNPTSWVNQGTNGGSATLVQCGSAILNGRKGVDFRLAGTSIGNYFQNFSGQPRAVFMVCKITSDIITASAHEIAFSTQGPGYINGYFGVYILSTNAPAISDWTWALVAHANDLNVWSAPETTYNPLNQDAIFTYVNSAISTSNNLIQVNGTTQTLQRSLLAGSYYIGNQACQLNGGSQANTYILYELLVYDGEVSSSDVTNVTNYLKNKWNL